MIWNILLWVVGIAIAICLPFGWLLLHHTIPPRYPIQYTPEDFQLPSHDVVLVTEDEIELAAWSIEHQPGDPWIIVTHGLGANRSDVLDMAAFLYFGGYNVLLFDFRAHGRSGGRSVSLGYLEQRDLTAAVEYLKRREGASLRLGLFGLSMGGVVSLLVAAQTPVVQAIAVDSIYTNLEDSIDLHLRAFYGIPSSLGRIPTRLFYRMRFGTTPRSVSPLDVMQQLKDRPILLINGEDDTRMPASGAKTLAAAGGPDTELWIISGAIHLQGYNVTTKAYQQRLLHFFHKHLPIS